MIVNAGHRTVRTSGQGIVNLHFSRDAHKLSTSNETFIHLDFLKAYGNVKISFFNAVPQVSYIHLGNIEGGVIPKFNYNNINENQIFQILHI